MSQNKTVWSLDDVERYHVGRHEQRLIAWHQHIITLATGILTLLVVLQNNYIPAKAQGLFLLQLCWISLSACIVSGILVLFGSAQGSLEMVNLVHNLRQKHGDAKTASLLQEKNYYNERSLYRHVRHLFLASFLIALVSLTWFASLNLIR